MEQNDLEAMRHLNRVLLAQNLANATAEPRPALIATIGLMAGATGFALLLGVLRWAGV